MRRSLLSLLVLLALPAAAQPSIGVRLGLSVADLVSEDGDPFEPRLGLAAGLVGDVPLSPLLSIRPEVLYVQKGFNSSIDLITTDNPDPIRETRTYQIDYVEIPLLLAVRVPTGSALDVAVEAGPAVAFFLDYTLDCDGLQVITPAECQAFNDQDIDLEPVDLGAALGLTVGAGPFDVGLRYTHGLRSIYRDDPGSDGLKVTNQATTVHATYRLRL